MNPDPEQGNLNHYVCLVEGSTAGLRTGRVCACACMHVCVRVHVRVRVHVCVHVCVRACMKEREVEVGPGKLEGWRPVQGSHSSAAYPRGREAREA